MGKLTRNDYEFMRENMRDPSLPGVGSDIDTMVGV